MHFELGAKKRRRGRRRRARACSAATLGSALGSPAARPCLSRCLGILEGGHRFDTPNCCKVGDLALETRTIVVVVVPLSAFPLFLLPPLKLIDGCRRGQRCPSIFIGLFHRVGHETFYGRQLTRTFGFLRLAHSLNPPVLQNPINRRRNCRPGSR